MAGKKKAQAANPVLATNRAAGHEFHLLERYEAGIVLLGPEVKSARQGRVSLKEAYAKIRQGEVFLLDAHFSPYTHATLADLDPVRPRKLLLNAREIRKLTKAMDSGGMTLVPTRMYLKNGKIKVEIAVARGKKLYDKRDSLRRKQAERDIKRALGSREIG